MSIAYRLLYLDLPLVFYYLVLVIFVVQSRIQKHDLRIESSKFVRFVGRIVAPFTYIQLVLSHLPILNR